MIAGRKNKGFTLVELLVVIAIIALLMAILMPVLHRARGEAHELVCMSILRNFSLAHKSYLAETGKYLPHTMKTLNPDSYYPWYCNDAFRRGIGLPLLSREQKKRRPIGTLQEWQPNVTRKYICPAATYALRHSEDRLFPIDRSYGVNIDGDFYARQQGVSNIYDKEGWVKHPSSKLFMADALDWWISQFFCDQYDDYGEDWLGFDTYGMTAFRHFNRLNVMYWDGHCGQLSAEEVIDNEYLWNPLK